MRNILLCFFLFFRITYLIKVEKQPLIRRLFILHPRNMVDKCGFKIMNEIKSFRKKNEKCQWNSAYVKDVHRTSLLAETEFDSLSNDDIFTNIIIIYVSIVSNTHCSDYFFCLIYFYFSINGVNNCVNRACP